MKALKIGQAIDLEVEDADPPATLRALVQKYELGECVLSVPDVALPPELVADARVAVRFCTSMGAHEARSSVIEVRPGQPPEVVLGEFHSEHSAQRRAFFRTSAHLPVEVSLLYSPMKTAKIGAADRRAVSIDVSGGGIKIETSLLVAPEDKLGIVVRVPQKLQPALPAVLLCEARVLRVQEVVRRGEDLYQVAASFLIRRETERDPWVKLAMDLERGLDRESAPKPDAEPEPK